MTTAKAYAAYKAWEPLKPFTFERREIWPRDVKIDILYCWICHSDIHTVRDEWWKMEYPLVPGHEIVGRVAEVGNEVASFKTGDLAGIGCMVDSCGVCPDCKDGFENNCDKGCVWTYWSIGKDGQMTQWWYSNIIVCDEHFVLKISDKLSLSGVAPLLCAGITTYSPLKHWKIWPNHKIAVLGLGGLWHMAVKFAVAFGADVTVLSTSPQKEVSAKELWAHHFYNTKDPSQIASLSKNFDFIVDTVSVPHNYDNYLHMLKRNGALICVWLPTEPVKVSAFSLVSWNKTITGSWIWWIPETQEMLDFCAEHDIVSNVEIISADYINEAYERVIKGDVKYRFVVDMVKP